MNYTPCRLVDLSEITRTSRSRGQLRYLSQKTVQQLQNSQNRSTPLRFLQNPRTWVFYLLDARPNNSTAFILRFHPSSSHKRNSK
ncbi:hypothetical protein P168DRAFT_286700 [Aspergillus campestris IBT 28561]|uniref:Uncharacterized protein n=1 Tax=Aspergillus campestris (strain IBT 28561) TaxID=1392248 RepID=A0A2I1DFD1_ASPC2|nr:uncharacterized protein P168DRAFT_286700 [Aspergillus campestris IBT 28561]PKY08585.1 hypothetical protein P168DRAFT_286700 [Aspergillus campestris IBT 28561]